MAEYWSITAGTVPSEGFLFSKVQKDAPFASGTPEANPANGNASRSDSICGSTPNTRGVWARFKFRQDASSPSRALKGITVTPWVSSSSSPHVCCPFFEFRSS